MAQPATAPAAPPGGTADDNSAVAAPRKLGGAGWTPAAVRHAGRGAPRRAVFEVVILHYIAVGHVILHVI